MANMVKTAMLLGAMTALFMFVGYLIGGQGGMLIALIVAAGMNLFSWWNSGKMVLRMHGAREVDMESAPELVEMVRQLADNAQMPMPKVYVLETDQPNAFATGRNPENGAVAASAGLLDTLSKEEVAAVMAHELAHIKNRDTLTMTIAATIAGAVGMLANFAFFFRGGRDNPLGMIGALVAMMVAPMAAGIVQMAISRAREYEADKDGAEICGNPLWLASALEKIAALSGRAVNWQAEKSPSTAHMFIINPLNGSGMDNLFSTHPATENRIAALRTLHNEWQAVPAEHEQPALPKRQKEVWGRNAGKWREEHPVVENDDVDTGGPWSRVRRQQEEFRKGPWS